MEFSERLKKVRKSTGLSQEEFAKKVGVTRNPIASAEIGKSRLYPATIHRIAETFNINEEWLSEGKGKMENTYGLEDDELKNLLSTYSKLTPQTRQKFLGFLESIVAEQSKEKE